MKRIFLLLLAVVSAPMAILAQPVHVSTGVTDATAAVPSPPYQSAFADYKRAVEPPTSPDKLWIQANREVSGQTQHGSHESSSMQMAPEPKDSAKPAADQHNGYHINKKGQ